MHAVVALKSMIWRRYLSTNHSRIFSSRTIGIANLQFHSHRCIRRPTAHLLLLIIWREELKELHCDIKFRARM